MHQFLSSSSCWMSWAECSHLCPTTRSRARGCSRRWRSSCRTKSIPSRLSRSRLTLMDTQWSLPSMIVLGEEASRRFSPCSGYPVFAVWAWIDDTVHFIGPIGRYSANEAQFVIWHVPYISLLFNLKSHNIWFPSYICQICRGSKCIFEPLLFQKSNRSTTASLLSRKTAKTDKHSAWEPQCVVMRCEMCLLSLV